MRKWSFGRAPTPPDSDSMISYPRGQRHRTGVSRISIPPAGFAGRCPCGVAQDSLLWLRSFVGRSGFGPGAAMLSGSGEQIVGVGAVLESSASGPLQVTKLVPGGPAQVCAIIGL